MICKIEGTKWLVAAFDNNGQLGGFHSVPWEFHAQVVHAGTLWTGGYSAVAGSDNRIACEKMGPSGAIDDAWEVVFVSPDRFVATKQGALYRFGKRV
ncbi:MAG: hypothetical protein JNJ46_12685 [Myxococcales bacterium]|nr:hypothetical protein [Myxococcales bacterium]